MVDHFIDQMRSGDLRYRTGLLVTPERSTAALGQFAARYDLDRIDLLERVLARTYAGSSFVDIGRSAIASILSDIARGDGEGRLRLVTNADAALAAVRAQDREQIVQLLLDGLPKTPNALLIVLPPDPIAGALVPHADLVAPHLRYRWVEERRIYAI